MKTRLFLIGILIFVLNFGFGQTTYVWDATTLASTSGSSPNITSATFVNPQGNNNGTTTQITSFSVSSGYTGASGTSNFGAAAFTGLLSTTTSTYFSTTVTPATGYGIQLNSINFGSRSTITGPQLISVYSSIDNYSSVIGSVTVSNTGTWALSTITFSTGLIGLASTPVTLRLYGSGGTGSPAINTANWRIDDIKLSVTAVIPPTITSLSATAGCLGQSLNITGTNLTGATAAGVTIGGVAVSAITSNSGTSMVVVVGTACSGTVSVTTSNGTGVSTPSYTAGATATYNTALGGWVSGITPDATKEIVFLSDFTALSNLSGCSCTVTNGNVVIPAPFNLTLLNQLTVTNNASTSFTLDNDASLIQSNPSTTINSGDIIVKRNSNSLLRLDYTLWSSPVENQLLKAFSPSTVDSRFYTYNTTSTGGGSTNGAYSFVPNVLTTPFNFGQGYLIRTPNTFSDTTPAVYPGIFTGVPRNGDKSFTAVNGGTTFVFNSVGNPYPSPISAASFIAENTANIESTLYFWRRPNVIGGASGYVTYNGGTVANNDTSNGTAGPFTDIQTGQGFLVAAKSSAPASFPIVFKNTMRTTASGQFFKALTSERHTIWLNLTNNAGVFAQMAAGYRVNATNDVDDFDAANLNDGVATIGSYLNDKNYIIQAKAVPFSVSDVIPLSLKVPADGNYDITIDHVDGLFVGGNQAVYLHDLFANSYTNLNLGSYTFAATAGTFNNRFEITYTANALSNLANDFNENSLILYKNNNEIVINSGNISIVNVKIYDIQGRLLVDKNNSNTNEVRLNVNTANQIVLVKTTLLEGQVITKKIIN